VPSRHSAHRPQACIVDCSPRGLGTPGTDAGGAFLAERSPLNHIERAIGPALIAQGLQDARVVAAKSGQMVTARKSRSVPAT